jgi:hypothetical protein
MEVNGQRYIQASLPPGNISWYPLDRNMHGPQSRFRPPSGLELRFSGRRICSLATILTGQLRLRLSTNIVLHVQPDVTSWCVCLLEHHIVQIPSFAT